MIHKQTNLYLSAIIGIILFTYIVGLDIVNFGNIFWLIDCPIICDAQQHLLGWLFFRETDILQFPLLKNTSFGLYTGSSLIYTDSLPIFAIIFKFFNSFLDFEFQYFGLWILISFSLQAIIADRILKIYIDDNKFRLISIVFFCISPIFLNKLFFSHLALASQWIILLTLYVYLLKDFKIKNWLLLIALSALVHGYYVGFTSIVFLMAISKEYLENKDGKFVAKSLLIYFAFLGILLYGLGYFMIGGGFTNHGFGKFKMNLNALFDPRAEVTLSASQIFPELETPSINEGFGDYEGFNFLGSGIVLMLIIITPIIIYHSNEVLKSLQKPVNKIILIFFFLITLYAISNNIYLGNSELFSYDMPRFTKVITKTFRSSGRFFWINYYLIYIFIFVMLYRYSNKFKYPILIIFLSIQFIDMQPTFQQVRNVFYKDKNSHSLIYKENIKLEHADWDFFAKKYKRIIYVVPTRFPREYFPLAYFAAKNKIETNFGYFSRVNKESVKRNNLRLLERLKENNFDTESLYVFFHEESWRITKQNNPDTTRIVDGYKLLTP
ncbi:hypothetical protein HN460_04140 [bacterium]|jgi:hypothetical protein|nr:hypothetical protein [bacterium]MBT3795246.1 hypothetical protein [bacterium]MBT4633845.1 hypothetical protein [bacterium]